MPYKVKGRTVYKEGKPWRKTSTHSKAVRMVRAIYANEKGLKKK